MNVHVVEVKSPTEVQMRTWERGSGITLACGTGACAVCVAGVLTGRTGRKLLAHLPGGDLDLEWPDDSASVFMTGPATEVFSGEWLVASGMTLITNLHPEPYHPWVPARLREHEVRWHTARAEDMLTKT